MARYKVTIEGSSRALHHGFTEAAQADLAAGPKVDLVGAGYEGEWMKTCFVTDEGEVYWPTTYMYAAIRKNASNFKIPGKRGKTYKDAVSAYLVVLGADEDPDRILTDVNIDQLDGNPLSPVYIDKQPVVVSRRRIIRERLGLNAGWRASFILETLEPIPQDTLRAMTELAGKTGIGDYRPRYGRFKVMEWVPLDEEEQGAEA